MKLLKCKICKGEMELIDNEYSISKQPLFTNLLTVKCTKCGFTNTDEDIKEPEVFIKRS